MKKGLIIGTIMVLSLALGGCAGADSISDIKALYEEADKELNRVWQQLKDEGKVTDSLCLITKKYYLL